MLRRCVILCFSLLTGGKIEHDCSPSRGIGYYLEPLLALGAFCKNPLNVTLKGVTNNREDPSPDLIKVQRFTYYNETHLTDKSQHGPLRN